MVLPTVGGSPHSNEHSQGNSLEAGPEVILKSIKLTVNTNFHSGCSGKDLQLPEVHTDHQHQPADKSEVSGNSNLNLCIN